MLPGQLPGGIVVEPAIFSLYGAVSLQDGKTLEGRSLTDFEAPAPHGRQDSSFCVTGRREESNMGVGTKKKEQNTLILQQQGQSQPRKQRIILFPPYFYRLISNTTMS